MKKKLAVIDLMNVAMRVYFGFSRGENSKLTTSSGKPSYVCYGVALAINRLIEQIKPDYLAIACDSGGKTFRHEAYPLYKSNRGEKDEEFRAQLPDLFRMLDVFGLKTIKVPQVEADDIIGSIAKQFASDDLDVFIVSGDKDFMQLVNPNVKICKSVTKQTDMGFETRYEVLGAPEVLQRFSCAPGNVVDILAIMGDAVDAIPGVDGIGEKGAAALVQAFGSLENIYANLGNLKPKIAEKLIKSQQNAFMSKKLATIKTDIELPYGIEDMKTPEPTDELRKFYAEMEFHSLLVQAHGASLEMPKFDGCAPDKPFEL